MPNMRTFFLITGLVCMVVGSQPPQQIMVDLTNDFGVCVLQLVSSRQENIAFSPYGLVSVAVVLYEGSRGPTAAEIHSTLNLPWDRHLTRVGFRDLHRYLKSYFTNDGFLRGLVLSKPNVTLKPNYLKLLRFYGFYTNTEPTTTTTTTPEPTQAARTEKPEVTTTVTTTTTIRTTTSESVEATTGDRSAGTTPPGAEPVETVSSVAESTATVTPSPGGAVSSPLTTEALMPDSSETTTETSEEAASTNVPETTTTSVPTTTLATTTLPTTTSVNEETTTKSRPEETTTKPRSEETTTVSETQEILSQDDSLLVEKTDTTKKDKVTSLVSPEKASAETTPDAPIPSTSEESTEKELAALVGSENPTTRDSSEAPSEAPTSSEELIELTNTSPRGSTDYYTSESSLETTSSYSVSSTRGDATTASFEESGMLTSGWPMASEESVEGTGSSTEEGSPETTSNEVTTLSSEEETSRKATTQAYTEETTSSASTEALTQEESSSAWNTEELASLLSSIADVETGTENMTDPSDDSAPTRMPRSLDPLRFGDEGVANWILREQHGGYSPPSDQWFFTFTGGESVPVITYTAYLPFAKVPQLSALALQVPLDDPRYLMVVVLPEERDGLDQLLYSLQWCPLSALMLQLKTTPVYAVLPSFTTVKHINLGPALAQLGIRRLFDPFRADLSEMSSEPHVFVRTIEQVVTVSLRKYYHNHRWFEATPNDVEQHFIANHPFVYFVLDKETNVALMAGTIVNPVTKQNQ